MNGVRQQEGTDYTVQGGELVFTRELAKERVGFWRWTAMFFALFGSYGRNDTVDVHYKIGGRDQVAAGLQIVPPEERDGHRDAGWQHFARAEWSSARDAFEEALAAEPGDPEALDGLGQALWWMGDRTRGHRAPARGVRRLPGARRPAARRWAGHLPGRRVADRRPARHGRRVAGAARRLLAEMGPVPEQGWLAVEEAKRADDPAAAELHAREALRVAHELTDPDVECMALAQLGRVVVRQGRVDEGVALLDEAMTVALGGESRDPLACGDACCTTLVVCDGLADLHRATQWCEAVVDFTERRHFVPLQSWCRAIYAGVLVRAGDWERAEAVLSEALQGRPAASRGGGRVLPLAVLAELRLRQGRLEEAEGLLEGLEDEAAALAPLVTLHSERGDLALARALLERGDHAGAGGERLVLWGGLLLAEGDLDAAAAVAERLRRDAEGLAREDLVAEAAIAWKGGWPARGVTTRPLRPGSRRPSAGSAPCATRWRRDAHGLPSRASSPATARRWRSPAPARRATRSNASGRAGTPTAPPPSCASSAPPGAPRSGATATR